MTQLLLLNGPNLNLLGTREPEKYGNQTLADIEKRVTQIVTDAGMLLSCYQSNAEHRLIERIHAAKTEQVAYILFNPAAYTHTSIALRDALLAVDIPFAEIHLTDPLQREAFRHRSYFSDIAQQVVTGLGAKGYEIAAQTAIEYLKRQQI